MIRKIQIIIPEPCHENWNTMTPVEKGKFCSACQKTVFDFTNKSDREILNTYNSNEKLCGRFLNTQLNRDIVIPKEKKSIWLVSIFFGALTFLSTKIQAQEKPTIVQTETQPDIQGKIAVAKDTVKERTITGVVSDASGPLPGVNVLIKGTNKGVSSDFNGNFSIKAKVGDILIFSFMGMEDKIVKITKKKKYYNIKIKLTNQVLGRLGINIIERKKTWFT